MGDSENLSLSDQLRCFISRITIESSLLLSLLFSATASLAIAAELGGNRNPHGCYGISLCDRPMHAVPLQSVQSTSQQYPDHTARDEGR